MWGIVIFYHVVIIVPAFVSWQISEPLLHNNIINYNYTVDNREAQKRKFKERKKKKLSVFANLIDFYKVLNPDWAGPWWINILVLYFLIYWNL